MLNFLFMSMFLIKEMTKKSSIVLNMLFLLFFLLCSEKKMMKMTYWGSVDLVSWWLMGLVLWLSGLCYLCASKKFLNKSFLMSLLGLNLFVLMSFFVRDIFYFYLLFESSLIPIIILIMGFGAQSEKLESSYYMFMYTMFGSLPLLGYIFYLSVKKGSSVMGLVVLDNKFFWLMMLMAFLIKFPLYSFHLWLLKAHLEAPTEGSMMLGGILLKLGGYGLLRVLSTNSGVFWLMMNFLIFFSLVGSLIMALSCLVESNIKLLIAKSSVVHMGPCVAAVLSMSDLNVMGLMGVMVGHGLCCSGLFFLVGVLYEQSGSRSVMFNSGGLNLSPLLSFFLFLLLVVNSSCPPSMNLLSEMILFMGLGNIDMKNILILGFISFFSLSYNMYLYSISQHGNVKGLNNTLEVIKVMTILLSLLQWLPINLFILMMFLLK